MNGLAGLGLFFSLSRGVTGCLPIEDVVEPDAPRVGDGFGALVAEGAGEGFEDDQLFFAATFSEGPRNFRFARANDSDAAANFAFDDGAGDGHRRDIRSEAELFWGGRHDRDIEIEGQLGSVKPDLGSLRQATNLLMECQFFRVDCTPPHMRLCKDFLSLDFGASD